MKNNCQMMSQDMLLDLHGELKGFRRFALQWHLRTCPDCREQRRRLATTTVALRHLIGRGPAIRSTQLLRIPALMLAILIAVSIAALLANRPANANVLGTQGTPVDGCETGQVAPKPAAIISTGKSCQIKPNLARKALE